MSLQANSNNERRLLKSLHSETMSAVTFISRARRPVSIYWLNYQGGRVRYCILNYGDRFPIVTYETHPWIFRDYDTGDILVTNRGQQVYYPEPWDGGEQNYVIIQIPVYTLREMCLQAVRKLVPPEEVKNLNIPLTLQQDLLQDNDNNRNYAVHVEVDM